MILCEKRCWTKQKIPWNFEQNPPNCLPKKKSIKFAIIWSSFVWDKSRKYTFFDDFLLLYDHQHSQYIQDRFTFTDPHVLIKLVTSATIFCYKNHKKYKNVPYFWIIKQTESLCIFDQKRSDLAGIGKDRKAKTPDPFFFQLWLNFSRNIDGNDPRVFW